VSTEVSLCDAVGTPCEAGEVMDAIRDVALVLGLMPEARGVLSMQAAFLAAHRA